MHTPTRTALIGPFTQGWISGIHHACNISPIMDSLPPLAVSEVLLNTMFQAGVDLLDIWGFDETINFDSSFWLKRIRVLPGKDKYDHISDRVKNLFRAYLPADYDRNPEFSPIWGWESFLTDLLFSLERNTVMVCSEIPDMEDIAGLLPPEIHVPIRNLCELITSEPLSVTMPKATIPITALKRFRTLVESDAFSSYVEAHARLDSRKLSLRDTLARVADSSRILQHNFPTLLKVRNIALAVLPATVKLVSTVFQQFPGEIAATFANRIEAWISNDRQIVIYEICPLMVGLVDKRLIQLVNQENGKKTDAIKATTSLQQRSLEQGLDKLSLAEINGEIKSVRKKHAPRKRHG